MSSKPDEDTTKCTNQVWGARDLNGERELESDGYFYKKNYINYYFKRSNPSLRMFPDIVLNTPSHRP